MYRATTPTHIFTLPFDTELVKEIRVTYEQEGVTILTKTVSECELDGADIKIRLTQEETLLFEPDKRVSIQLRVLTSDNQVMASDVTKVWAYSCLDEEILS